MGIEAVASTDRPPDDVTTLPQPQHGDDHDGRPSYRRQISGNVGTSEVGKNFPLACRDDHPSAGWAPLPEVPERSPRPRSVRLQALPCSGRLSRRY